MNSLSCLLNKDELIRELRRIQERNQVTLMISECNIVMGLNAFERHIYVSWNASQKYDLVYSRANHKGCVKTNDAPCYTIHAFNNAEEVFVETFE